MKIRWLSLLKNMIYSLSIITIAAFIVAFALEYFLVPNNIIDGGILGLSIIFSSIFSKPLGIFIFFLNLPFIFLALSRFGKTFVFYTFYAVSVLSIAVQLFHNSQVVTNDKTLACVFGGILLGVGVGLILRNNASLDGTEIVSIALSPKTAFSVGELIMFFNLFIFFTAGFVFGWENALYSVLTYFIAYRVIDMVLEGFNESKSLFVISNNSQEIGKQIMSIFGRSVTYLDVEGGYSGETKKMLYCVITRLELTKVKQLIKAIDNTAFIAVENVHEVDGIRFKKKSQGNSCHD